MSAIGGTVDLRRGTSDFAMLNKMRLAMSMRGRRRSSAYIGKYASMLYNSSSPDAFSEEEDSQPAIFERGGRQYVLCFDGEVYKCPALFERYRIDGIDFLGSLEGGFSIALFDGERRMLLLARDRAGIRPLYYQINDGHIYFASEIRGILAASGERVTINGEILSFHLSAPCGVYRAANIYADITEVLPGECVIFTELGMSRFRYRDQQLFALKNSTRRKRAIEPYEACNSELIDNALSELLIAFEYPQFDYFMPSLCEAIALCAKRNDRAFAFYDPMRISNLSYSYERDDRLGAFYGLNVTGVPTREPHSSFDGDILMRDLLIERFENLPTEDKNLLKQILGERKYDYFARRFSNACKKEDAKSEIRILGMLCQTVMWAHSQKLVIRRSGELLYQSALSIM